MNWLQCIFYGLISGLTEFLPISARAHEDIFLYMFGIVQRDPVMSLMIHIALLVSLFMSLRTQLDQLKRENALKRRNRRRSVGAPLHMVADVRLVKNAALPMLIVMVLLRYILVIDIQLPLTSLLLLINGIILFLPERMMHGNKDAFGMSLLDSYFIGIMAGLSVLSGLSAIALVMAVSLARGAQRQKAWNWALLLCIPILSAKGIMDLISIFSGAGLVPFFPNLLKYLIAGVFAFGAGRLAIFLMRRLIRLDNTTVFSYYSWGAALFSFLLFLSVS